CLIKEVADSLLYNVPPPISSLKVIGQLMENSDISKYVNLPFGGEMDGNVVMSEEMGNVSMSQYINDTERHDGQSLGNLGGATIENGNGFTVEDLNYIHFDEFVHSDTIAVTDGPQIIWNI
ncbi:5344_t:CDS:2, partial [Racocetra persica]